MFSPNCQDLDSVTRNCVSSLSLSNIIACVFLFVFGCGAVPNDNRQIWKTSITIILKHIVMDSDMVIKHILADLWGWRSLDYDLLWHVFNLWTAAGGTDRNILALLDGIVPWKPCVCIWTQFKFVLLSLLRMKWTSEPLNLDPYDYIIAQTFEIILCT